MNKLTRLSLLWLAGMVFLMASARAQGVRYNFDQNADFSKYKTYKWVTLPSRVGRLYHGRTVRAQDFRLAEAVLKRALVRQQAAGKGVTLQ